MTDRPIFVGRMMVVRGMLYRLTPCVKYEPMHEAGNVPVSEIVIQPTEGPPEFTQKPRVAKTWAEANMHIGNLRYRLCFGKNLTYKCVWKAVFANGGHYQGGVMLGQEPIDIRIEALSCLHFYAGWSCPDRMDPSIYRVCLEPEMQIQAQRCLTTYQFWD